MKESVKVQCHGRGFKGEPVLEKPVAVTVELRRPPGSPSISVGPTNCPYNTGGHGQRCKASHPNEDKVGDGVVCPFSFDYPYVLEWELRWKPPQEIAAAFDVMKQRKDATA